MCFLVQRFWLPQTFERPVQVPKGVTLSRGLYGINQIALPPPELAPAPSALALPKALALPNALALVTQRVTQRVT